MTLWYITSKVDPNMAITVPPNAMETKAAKPIESTLLKSEINI